MSIPSTTPTGADLLSITDDDTSITDGPILNILAQFQNLNTQASLPRNRLADMFDNRCDIQGSDNSESDTDSDSDSDSDSEGEDTDIVKSISTC